MTIAILNQTPRMGRPKKTNAVKRSYRFDKLNLAMLKIYADRHCMDITTAMNSLLRQTLVGQGLLEEGKAAVEEEDKEEDETDDPSPSTKNKRGKGGDND